MCRYKILVFTTIGIPIIETMLEKLSMIIKNVT